MGNFASDTFDWALNQFGKEGLSNLITHSLKFHADNKIRKTVIQQKLYLMSRGDGYYKIGVSIDPKARVGQLQVGCNLRLKLIKTYGDKDSFKIEQFILSKFPERIGEWVYLGENGKERIDILVEEWKLMSV